MIRKLCSLVFALAFVVAVCGCAENEYRTKQEKQVQTESQPQDVSPGEPIVE
jgi:uncharacterized lipoprotein YehR (DUF1307 family)